MWVVGSSSREAWQSPPGLESRGLSPGPGRQGSCEPVMLPGSLLEGSPAGESWAGAGTTRGLPRPACKGPAPFVRFENGVLALYSHTQHTGAASNYLSFLLFNSHWHLVLIMCQAVV